MRQQRVLLVCSRIQEKGHGSAMDMARRKRVRHTSERDVGMFDIVISAAKGEFHSQRFARFVNTNSFFLTSRINSYFGLVVVLVFMVVAVVVVVVMAQGEDWSFWHGRGLVLIKGCCGNLQKTKE